MSEALDVALRLAGGMMLGLLWGAALLAVGDLMRWHVPSQWVGEAMLLATLIGLSLFVGGIGFIVMLLTPL